MKQAINQKNLNRLYKAENYSVLMKASELGV